MKPLISTLFLLFYANISNAQLTISNDKSHLLYKNKPVDHRKYSYIKIDKIHHFAIVTFDTLNKELKGCYNFDGKAIVPPQFAEIDVQYIKNKPYFQVAHEIEQHVYQLGIYNLRGELVLPIQFSSIEIFNYEENLTFIHGYNQSKNGKFCESIYSTNGNLVVSPVYTSMSIIYDEMRHMNFIKIQKDSFYGITDTSGNIIIPLKYINIEFAPIENNNQETYFLAKDQQLFYLYNSRGTLITNQGHDEISVGFCGGHRLFANATRCADGKLLYGFADRISGKQITPKKYTGYTLLAPDLFSVRLDSTWGLVDISGEIIKPKYYFIETFGDSGTCGVTTSEYSLLKVYLPKEQKFLEGEFNMIDEQWPYVVLTNDSSANNSQMNRFYHLLEHQMLKDTFSNYQYSYIKTTSKNKGIKIKENRLIALCSKGDQWFILKGLTKESIPGKWKACKALSETLFAVQQNGKYGMIDKNGKIVLPFDFNEISLRNKNEILLKKDNFFGMCNEKGKIFIPIEYSSEFEFYGELAMVKKGNESFYINRKNKRKKA